MSKPVKTWLEMALFFYQSFKHTTREKILEQTDTYHDAAYFRELSNKELPMAYAERMGRIASKQASLAPRTDGNIGLLLT